MNSLSEVLLFAILLLISPFLADSTSASSAGGEQAYQDATTKSDQQRRRSTRTSIGLRSKTSRRRALKVGKKSADLPFEYTPKQSKMPKKSKAPSRDCINDIHPTVSSLDLSRYEGRWYQLYTSEGGGSPKNCGAANYVYNPPNPVFGGPPTVTVENTGVCGVDEACSRRGELGQFFKRTGSGLPNPAFPDEDGKYLVTLPPFTFNYWVAHVIPNPEEENGPYKYAAVYDPLFPGNSLVYILSRERTVDPREQWMVDELLGKIESAGISLDTLVPTYQGDDCVYE